MSTPYSQQSQALSQLVASPDVSLSSGQTASGGAATNNGAVLTAFLLPALGSSNRTLNLDGATAVTGLVGPASGHCSIVGNGADTGFFTATGNNDDCLRFGAALANGGTAPAISGANVRLSDFFINGNRGNGTTGNSTTGNPQGNNPLTRIYCGIALRDTQQVRIERVGILNSPGFGIQLTNCKDIVIDSTRIEVNGSAGLINTDGIHINGGCSQIRISNCYFYNTGDDAIAFNAPEGYTGGAITNALVENCIVEACATFARLYTYNNGLTAGSTIQNVRFLNCIATCVTFGFQWGLNANGAAPGVADAITGVEVDSCTLTAPYLCPMSQNTGTLSFKNTTRLAPTQANAWCYTTSYAAVTISNLEFMNCRITQNAAGSAAGFAVAAIGGSTFKRIELNGFSIQAASGTTRVTVPYLLTCDSSSFIQQIVINAVDSTGITNLLNTYPSGCVVSGAGVLATGWAIPDANMANNVPFISATSGVPSIMVGGVRKTIGLS